MAQKENVIEVEGKILLCNHDDFLYPSFDFYKWGSLFFSSDQPTHFVTMMIFSCPLFIFINEGSVFSSEQLTHFLVSRFLNAVKQYLCLSLLKNSALSVMAIFQLLCSIFQNLISKFRSVLKSEIGIFFPMLILRVLENVLQPSFLQKMTILSLLEKMSQDPQFTIDIFVNYDCDVEAPNIFERYQGLVLIYFLNIIVTIRQSIRLETLHVLPTTECFTFYF